MPRLMQQSSSLLADSHTSCTQKANYHQLSNPSNSLCSMEDREAKPVMHMHRITHTHNMHHLQWDQCWRALHSASHQYMHCCVNICYSLRQQHPHIKSIQATRLLVQQQKCPGRPSGGTQQWLRFMQTGQYHYACRSLHYVDASCPLSLIFTGVPTVVLD